MNSIKVNNQIVFQSTNPEELMTKYIMLRNSSWRNQVFLTKN